MTLRYFNFIPTYNNSKTVLDIVERTLTSSRNPLLVIDDGSAELVSQILETSEKTKVAIKNNELFIIRFEKNKGKGAALKKAVHWGVLKNFTHMITIDSDGQFAPEEISKIQEASISNPWDYILGERTFPSSTPQSSIFGRDFSNMWVKFETGLELTDTQTGFRCYPLFWAQNITSFRNRFAFELELIVKGIWLGAGARCIPVSVVYPDDRVSHFKKFRDNLSLTILHTQLCTWRILNLVFSMKKTKAWSGEQSKPAQLGTNVFTSLIKFSGLKPAYFLLIFVSFFYYIFGFSTRRALSEYWRNINPKIGFFSLQKNIYLNIYRFGQSLVDFYYIKSHPQLQKEILTNFKGITLPETVLLSGHFGYWNVAADLFNQFFNKDIVTVEYAAGDRSFEDTISSEVERTKILSRQSNENELVFSFYDSQKKDQSTAGLIDRPIGNRYELVRFFNRLMPIDIGFGLAAKAIKSEVSFFALTKEDIAKFHFTLVRPQIKFDKKNPASSFLWASEFSKFYEDAALKTPHAWANFYTPWMIHPNEAKPKELQAKKSRIARPVLVNPLEVK